MTQEELDNRIIRLEKKVNNLKTAIETNKAAKAKHTQELNVLKLKRANIDNPKPVSLSDHALVRYMERSMKLDFESMREQIITPGLQALIESHLGTGSVNHEGFRYVVQDYQIVTITPENVNEN